ncbi:hypothetical protein CDO28_13875 [Sinorhizobium meliloti]|nr:hypothetical protein CDO28_13875 [Sinorhizobium meliloti]
MARADGPFGAYARFSPSSGLPATFSPHAGRRDKRRQLNSAFTARSRERAGAAYPFSPLAGRRWRQPDEGPRGHINRVPLDGGVRRPARALPPCECRAVKMASR